MKPISDYHILKVIETLSISDSINKEGLEILFEFSKDVGSVINSYALLVSGIFEVHFLLILVCLNYYPTLTDKVFNKLLLKNKIFRDIFDKFKPKNILLIKKFKKTTLILLISVSLMAFHIDIKSILELLPIILSFSVLCLCYLEIKTGLPKQLIGIIRDNYLSKKDFIKLLFTRLFSVIIGIIFVYLALLSFHLELSILKPYISRKADYKIERLIIDYSNEISHIVNYDSEKVQVYLQQLVQPTKNGYSKLSRKTISEFNNLLYALKKSIIFIAAIFLVYYVAIPLYWLEFNKPIVFLLISFSISILLQNLTEEVLPNLLGIIKYSFIIKIGLLMISFVILLLVDAMLRHIYKR